MRFEILILLFLNSVIPTSGQDSLKFHYSIYYPDGKKYTGSNRDFDRLNNELEEKGRVWTYTIVNDKKEYPSVVGFKLFTSFPLWVYTVEDSSQIDSLIKRVNPEELMNIHKIESELKKHINNGSLSDIFILQTLGPPDKLKYYDDENSRVSQWTYLKLRLYLIFTNRIVSNYIKMDNYR